MTSLGSASSKARIILGTMTFGEHGVGSRIKDVKKIEEVLSYFKEQGHDELDTARMYCDGNTEEVLGKIGVQREPWSFKLATKVYPNKDGDHHPDKLRTTFETSLKALQTNKVNIFYLHAPDHGTSFDITLGEVNKLHKEGKFEELGLSNYTSWQVAEIYQICKSQGYVLPTVYQGMYNLITRNIETELFPALKKYGIRFYAYNPLCGGMASGQYKMEEVREDGSRFDPTMTQGQRYRERYWKEAYFNAVKSIRNACHGHNISPTEVALRWIVNHSKINPRPSDNGQDAVIIGVSSLEHTKDNLRHSTLGPLPDALLETIDKAWLSCMPSCPAYFR